MNIEITAPTMVHITLTEEEVTAFTESLRVIPWALEAHPVLCKVYAPLYKRFLEGRV